MASLVGAQRRYRRPMFFGVGLALIASAITWVVAQTVLTSLQRYGEKLEAIVSLVAIGVLLLILNWFYHRVYWQENLQSLHQRKRRVLAGAGLSLAAAQVAGLVLLGFTSVYREGFETVLFLQAMTLEAGAVAVLEGVLLGFLAVVAVFVLVVALERKLPHKKMLIATGVLITWVLVVMVGTTVQTMQKVGWVAVTPIEGLELPYWAGLWLGLYPTWQGIGAQAAAAVFVVGSYFGAEALRKRRRARRLATVTPDAGSVVRASQATSGFQPSSASASPWRRASASTSFRERLAAGTEPRSPAADARLRDRRSAAPARLAVATVDAELVLHRPRGAVGSGIVAKGRALAVDPGAQGRADRAREPRHLLVTEPVRRPQRVEPCTPERLVGVDVPEAGDHTLIEEDRLQRRPPSSELRREPARREARAERLRAVLRREVRRDVGVLEDEPGPEPPYVPVDEARAVVQLQHSALVRDGREPEAPRHPQVYEEAEPALEPDEEVLPVALDRDDGVALELFGDLEEVVRSRESWIEDLHADERSALEAWRELRPDGLDLRQLRHYATTSSRIPCACGASAPIAYAACTALAVDRADSSSRACTSARTSPATTASPRFRRQTTPTA